MGFLVFKIPSIKVGYFNQLFYENVIVDVKHRNTIKPNYMTDITKTTDDKQEKYVKATVFCATGIGVCLANYFGTDD